MIKKRMDFFFLRDEFSRFAHDERLQIFSYNNPTLNSKLKRDCLIVSKVIFGNLIFLF